MHILNLACHPSQSPFYRRRIHLHCALDAHKLVEPPAFPRVFEGRADYQPTLLYSRCIAGVLS
jgi:hypothetical protein